MDTKARPVYMLFIRAPFQTQEHIQAESVVVEKKTFHTNRNQKKVGVANSSQK